MNRLYAVALLVLLAACSGGHSTSALLPQPQSAEPLGSVVALQATTEAQSDALQRSQPSYTPSASDLLYVANAGANSITVYKQNANGNAAPVKIIAGTKTGIRFESGTQLSEDAAGNLYVANGSSVLVFTHGANGNVAPVRKLAGPNTGITNVKALTVDQTTGKLFAMDERNDGFSAILRFPPNAAGNQAPFAVSTVSYHPAIQLASDSTGKNFIEAYSAWCCNPSVVGVDTLPKQFASDSSPKSVYGLSPMVTAGVTDDPSTKTYLVASFNEVRPIEGELDGIYRFKEDTVGGFKFGETPTKFEPAIVSIITSAKNCGQLALGYERNIYAACGTNTIDVYPHDASGNVVPLRVLKGSATKLNQPVAIYEGQ